MKTLIKIIALCFPVLMFSQNQDSLALIAKETAKTILKEKRRIDSIHQLRQAEINKQIALIKQIKSKINQLKSKPFFKENGGNFSVAVASATEAIKPSADVVYIEETRRKWLGRLFNKSDTRIRLFRFVDGRKVYLN